jgi:hypothetical protein
MRQAEVEQPTVRKIRGGQVSILAIPKICLNGNTKTQVVEELRDVFDKLDVAVKALEGTEYFNSRNFQIQSALDGGVLARKAREEHGERLDALRRVRHELLELAYEVNQQ